MTERQLVDLEACPICHAAIASGDPVEFVPVCPIVYADVQGLRCHRTCLEAERERTRKLRREDLRPTLLSRRVADR